MHLRGTSRNWIALLSAVGMGLMAAFGLGTVPALFLVAKLADLGWLMKWRSALYKAGGLLMAAVGAYFVVSGIRY